MTIQEFEPGERVIYRKEHFLTGTSKQYSHPKMAVFIRISKQRYRDYGKPSKAVIHVDGNKGYSSVPVTSLHRADDV